MNPRQFLTIGGAVLIVVGLLGFVGVIGPTPEQSIFGTFWWFDNAENWAHLVLGIVAVLAGYFTSVSFQRPLVTIVGVLAVFAGIWGIFSANFLGANLENPADTILHIVIGAWALWAATGYQATTTRMRHEEKKAA